MHKCIAVSPDARGYRWRSPEPTRPTNHPTPSHPHPHPHPHPPFYSLLLAATPTTNQPPHPQHHHQPHFIPLHPTPPLNTSFLHPTSFRYPQTTTTPRPYFSRIFNTQYFLQP
ncbi:hypothetical protein M0802_004835 [Mischocyttarus mexicanus]|nr:hypothetical protein M0802_004835 [Mischocyttarus mexicanus]